MSSDVSKAIDDAWYADQEGPRPHLGASQIGGLCERELVYSFRHAKTIKHEGRMCRLFKRGHLEEPHIYSHLRRIGFEIQEFAQRLTYHDGSESYMAIEWDDDSWAGNDLIDVTGDPHHVKMAEISGIKLKQWKFAMFGGHHSGSTDGRGRLPLDAVRDFEGITKGVWFLTENKTYGRKQFEKLLAETSGPDRIFRFAEFKPRHYWQVQEYMDTQKLPFALYIAVCKDDDSIHTLVIPFDPDFAAKIPPKALRVIMARQLPARKWNSPSNYDCKYCDFHGPCWRGEALEKKCRTCTHVVPVDNARFHCSLWNSVIPKDVEKTGCDNWQTITD